MSGTISSESARVPECQKVLRLLSGQAYKPLKPAHYSPIKSAVTGSSKEASQGSLFVASSMSPCPR